MTFIPKPETFVKLHAIDSGAIFDAKIVDLRERGTDTYLRTQLLSPVASAPLALTSSLVLVERRRTFWERVREIFQRPFGATWVVEYYGQVRHAAFADNRYEIELLAPPHFAQVARYYETKYAPTLAPPFHTR